MLLILARSRPCNDPPHETLKGHGNVFMERVKKNLLSTFRGTSIGCSLLAKLLSRLVNDVDARVSLSSGRLGSNGDDGAE